MNSSASVFKCIKILSILVPLFIISTFTGCDGFDIPVGAIMVPPEDTNSQPDSIRYYLLLTGYDKVFLEQGKSEGNTNSIPNSGFNSVKYYEVQESCTIDFSDSINTFVLNENYFKPASTSIQKKYYRARAIFDDSISEWSNVVAVRKSI
jgi:ABC-type metal ion transport system substrate-binding protein